MSLAVFTVVGSNYLHFARTLMQGIAAHHPEAVRYCVVVARTPDHAVDFEEEFETLSLAVLGLPDGDDFFFQYNIVELCTAVKPWALEYLLDQGYDKIMFIDPDIYVYRPLTEAVQLLDSGADVVLTPHLLSPMTDVRQPDELDIRRMGVHNLGFFAAKQSDNVRRLLHWWQEKLHRNCELAVEKGIFVDQGWCDLIPGMFDRVALLRHPGYNVAFWNLAERHISLRQDGVPCAGGHLLTFFHFSGINSSTNPAVLSRWRPHPVINRTLRTLLDDYRGALRANGWAYFADLPYDFGYYTDGSAIADVERIRFRRDTALRFTCQGSPFAHVEQLRLEPRHAAQWYASAGPFSSLRNVPSVQSLAEELLGRAAQPAELNAWLPGMNSRIGRAWLLISLGLSREARSTPGWLARLAHFVNHSPLAPAGVKVLVSRPLEQLLAAVSVRYPRLAHRPIPTPRNDSIAPKVSRDRFRLNFLPPKGSNEGPCGINLIGYLKAELGIGEAARSLARSCEAAGISYTGVDVGYQVGNRQSDDTLPAATGDKRYPVDILYVNADMTPVTVQHLHSIGHVASYRIGFWHWEQPVLPRRFHDAFSLVDELWVPSTFVLEAVMPVSPVPVYRIPHALSFTPGAQASRAGFGLPEDKLLVLVMYDFHSYHYRKNPQAAIAAFRRAAAVNQSLGLVIKTINGEHHHVAAQELADSLGDLPHVTLIDTYLTRQQTWDLESCCDILLSLHRAEGFGLAPAEMMYLGKPVVATGWSANMDFMNVSNSMPVRYELKPLTRDLGPYEAGALWAEADIEHAAWCLRKLAAEQGFAQHLGNQARETIRRDLDPRVVGERVAARLKSLAQWYPAVR